MAEVDFLPGFNIASPQDVRKVYTPGARVEMPEGGLPREMIRAREDGHNLEGKQTCARSLGRLSAGGIFEEPPESWEELVEGTDEWLGGHLEGVELDDYHEVVRFRTLAHTIKHVRQVARDAIITMSAYMEVTPKVLMNRDFEDPNREIAGYASRGMGFVLAWSGLHDQVDKPLAYSLAERPRPQDRIYGGMLHFNSKWFTDHAGYVVLDPDRVAGLRDDSHHKHPADHDSGKSTLFGCPGRHMIPILYRGMLRDATAGELFARTYHEERMNHGYTEYHVEPGADEPAAEGAVTPGDHEEAPEGLDLELALR